VMPVQLVYTHAPKKHSTTFWHVSFWTFSRLKLVKRHHHEIQLLPTVHSFMQYYL